MALFGRQKSSKNKDDDKGNASPEQSDSSDVDGATTTTTTETSPKGDEKRRQSVSHSRSRSRSRSRSQPPKPKRHSLGHLDPNADPLVSPKFAVQPSGSSVSSKHSTNMKSPKKIRGFLKGRLSSNKASDYVPPLPLANDNDDDDNKSNNSHSSASPKSVMDFGSQELESSSGTNNNSSSSSSSSSSKNYSNGNDWLEHEFLRMDIPTLADYKEAGSVFLADIGQAFLSTLSFLLMCIRPIFLILWILIQFPLRCLQFRKGGSSSSSGIRRKERSSTRTKRSLRPSKRGNSVTRRTNSRGRSMERTERFRNNENDN